MMTMLRRLLPLALLLTLGIPGIYAQLDCSHPVDVRSPRTRQANVTFPASSGETVYIRLLANSVDPGFALNPPVVVDQFSNVRNPRARNQVPGQDTAGATPIDLAGGVYPGENFTGWEFDLSADGMYTLQLAGTNLSASASIHVVLTRINRPCAANTTLTCGRSLPGNISTTSPGQVDTYQFAVQTGDLVSFRLLRVASSGLPDTSTSFFFAIYAADPTQDNRPYVVNVDATRRSVSRSRRSTAAMIGRPPSPAP